MKVFLRRVAALVSRIRLDRKLPPVVGDLYVPVAKLRSRSAFRKLSERLPHNRGEPGDTRIRLGKQTVWSAGPLELPTSELGHEIATRVVDALEDVGLKPFLVDRAGDGFEFGLMAPDRTVALRALQSHMTGDAVYMTSPKARRHDAVVDLHEVGPRSALALEPSWRIFVLRGHGSAVFGPDQATTISFWDVGASGKAERLGDRGHPRFDPTSDRTTEVVNGRRYPGIAAFPVQNSLRYLNDPVDIVFTWVDGSDPLWRHDFNETAKAEGRSLLDPELHQGRFHTREELRYSLRSVWAYCGWARNIYVVTAGQAPDWLVESDGLRLMDHADILPAAALPTFNSHAIEAALHKIDGLSEHFIYFNDDVAVGRPVQPELFFTPNGLARVFTSEALVDPSDDDTLTAFDTAAMRNRALLATRFHRVVRSKPDHAPFPLRRSTLERLEQEFATEITATIHSKFRSPHDLSVAASLAQHYGLIQQDSIVGDIAVDYVNVDSARLSLHLDRILHSKTFDAFCINEASGTVATENQERLVRDFYNQMFPTPAPWERSDTSTD